MNVDGVLGSDRVGTNALSRECLLALMHRETELAARASSAISPLGMTLAAIEALRFPTPPATD